jgi:imidazolonepropionase
VALGSDFNPNAHCMSMPMVMNMACVNMRMTMKEALVAATINAAGKSKLSSSQHLALISDALMLVLGSAVQAR